MNSNKKLNAMTHDELVKKAQWTNKVLRDSKAKSGPGTPRQTLLAGSARQQINMKNLKVFRRQGREISKELQSRIQARGKVR